MSEGGSPVFKKDWVVTKEAFERLLSVLDSDRERAGERYEQIRQKLSKFFQWRGCAATEELADRTIDRATRRIGEGEEIRTNDPYLFFHGIAINVLREHWKEAQRAPVKPLEEAPEFEPAAAPDDSGEAAEGERKMECLDSCVRQLPKPQLHIVMEYHLGEGGARIARRNALAEELGIPLNALRIRAFRIRGELESCVCNCLKRPAA
jgi:DNA-directed RNA polymerase specialized sigma24 family protein